MLSQPLFLVKIGSLSDGELEIICNEMARIWDCKTVQQDCKTDPNRTFERMEDGFQLVQLKGDAAKTIKDGSNWLEALGAWKKPTLLMTCPCPNNEISGEVTAYAALCEKLSVPLIGIVQVGGKWNKSLRKKEGLPWCGKIPSMREKQPTPVDQYYELDKIMLIIKKTLLNY